MACEIILYIIFQQFDKLLDAHIEHMLRKSSGYMWKITQLKADCLRAK